MTTAKQLPWVPEAFHAHFPDVTKTGNGERGAGNGERGAGNGERGTEVWERVVSGNLHKIQYGR